MHEASRSERVRFEKRTPTSFPSSAPSGHPVSSVREPAGEESRCRHDGPTETHVLHTSREGRALPVDRGVFHRRARERRGPRIPP